MVVEGGLHLELVVHEEVGILFDALLVDDAFRIVLIVVVLEFAARNGDSVDSHHDGIFLSSSCQCQSYQCKADKYLFHLNGLNGVNRLYRVIGLRVYCGRL